MDMSDRGAKDHLGSAEVDHVAARLKARVGVRRLRSGLSGYVARAAAGETIVVTIDGKPKARLAPLERDGELSLEVLAQTGAVQRPGHPGTDAASSGLDGELRPLRPPGGIDVVRLLGRIRG